MEWTFSWLIVSFWIWVIWGFALGEPDTFRKRELLGTIVVAIIAFPMTVALIIVAACIGLIIKYRSWRR